MADWRFKPIAQGTPPPLHQQRGPVLGGLGFAGWELGQEL
jgi:hypothetical protein